LEDFLEIVEEVDLRKTNEQSDAECDVNPRFSKNNTATKYNSVYLYRYQHLLGYMAPSHTANMIK